jgi:signal peptidase I
MAETLPGESYILVDKLAYQQNTPRRGDIVYFNLPMDPEQGMMKRVIGLPGEAVLIDQGRVSINGTPIDEPYISKKAPYSGEWEIPTGQYFVLGDNRPDSSDSHNWGFVPRENITGKAVWIYFPFDSFGEILDDNFPP